jgi:hypothetical protein
MTAKSPPAQVTNQPLTAHVTVYVSPVTGLSTVAFRGA